MTEQRPWRLFVGLPLPDPVRAEVSGRVGHLKEFDESARWVRAENLHLTLLFIGARDQADVPQIVHEIENVAAQHRPFVVELSRSGSFGGGRRGRVLWLGVGRGGREAAQLSRDLGRAIPPLDEEHPASTRDPRPHLTLAREASGGVAARAKSLFDDLSPIEWSVERIHLYRSHLGRGAPVYEELAAFDLHAGDPSGLRSSSCP